MANTPIQIVINSGDYISEQESQGGGGNIDFFKSRDSDFMEHKRVLCRQLREIKEMQNSNEFSRISYAKIKLEPSAIAKSHRPTEKLFKGSTTPIVGAGALGELFVELNPESVDDVIKNIEKAEEHVRKDSKGEKPTRIRSEVGATASIEPYMVSDKRNFSVSQALEWLSDSRTGGFYFVELFDFPCNEKDWSNMSNEKQLLFSSFIEGLKSLDLGLHALHVIMSETSPALFGIKLVKENKVSIQKFSIKAYSSRNYCQCTVDLRREAHIKLINFMDKHPLVKKVSLPPFLTQNSTHFSTKIGEKAIISNVDKTIRYPRLGIVDGGISDVFGDWIIDRWGLVSDADKNMEHGSFIAGLAILGKSINDHRICPEDDGCSIVDVDIFPTYNFETYYPNLLDFFGELNNAVAELKKRTGVRIFNMSLNVSSLDSKEYSIYAQQLDEIAENNDVIFVISVGNINCPRKEWSSNPIEALKIFISRVDDSLKPPAESCRNLSVSALNPPNLKDIVPFGFSNYSCRGYDSMFGMKPDLAHVGGAGKNETGLFSITSTGYICDGSGTSYSAPLVAKTLACLENAIEGYMPRETLIALMVNSALTPNPFQDKRLDTLTKYLVGFGMPQASQEILDSGEHAITLVFTNKILPKKELSFDFSWPSCLVKKGKCIGRVRLTIVYTPPLDYRYGAEFVRINVDAHLRQMQDNNKYKGMLKPLHSISSMSFSRHEKNLIDNSFKWCPIKVYERTFIRGIGQSRNWRLVIEGLSRSGVKVPMQGVPFTAILTISDPMETMPVFNEMRQSLTAHGVQLVDVRVANRITPRV